MTAGCTGGNRLSERTGGQNSAVAEARITIDHQERQILAQRRVLQPVVQHQYFRPCFDGGPGAGGAVRAGPGRRDLGQQHRFVPRFDGRVGRTDAMDATAAAAIATRQEMHPVAARDKPSAEVERQRGLAGPAHRDVAATDHRHRRTPARARHAPSRDPRCDRTER